GSAGPASLAADRISPCPCPLSLTSDMSVLALPVECQGEARRALAYYRYGPLPRLPASVRPRRPLLRRLRRGIIERIRDRSHAPRRPALAGAKYSIVGYEMQAAVVSLAAGQTVMAEPGTLLYMRGAVEMNTGMTGG